MKSFEYRLEIDNDEDTILMNVRIEYKYDYEEEILEIDNVYHFSDAVNMWIPVSYDVWKEFKDSIEDKINMLEDKARLDYAASLDLEKFGGDV